MHNRTANYSWLDANGREVGHRIHGESFLTSQPAGMRPSAQELKARLESAFPGDPVEVIDDSHRHAGHAGAAGGAGHYAVRILSHRFDGLGHVARHRLVYDAVADWIPARVHALAIDARLPSPATPPTDTP